MNESPRDLRALPKTDLHVHLEGSIRPGTLADLADRHGVEIPDGLRAGGFAFRDFAEFIELYVLSCTCLIDLEDFRRVAHEFCQDQAAQGVRWAEVSFSLPEHGLHIEDWDGPVEAVLDGFERGAADFGIECRMTIDAVRGVPLEVSEQAVRSAIRHRDRGAISVGLGGSERFPPEPYAAMFREAREAGLHSVPHAGETGGPASIRGALEALGAERIGHGIRALEDRRLVGQLVDMQIPLEVCPTSNVATGLVPSLEDHPLLRLMEAGLALTLASDDPALFSSPILGEYEAARRVFGLDDEALAGLARSGVHASFADQATKAELVRGIDAWIGSGGVG